jgi:CheY-like chemotaxis protein
MAINEMGRHPAISNPISPKTGTQPIQDGMPVNDQCPASNDAMDTRNEASRNASVGPATAAPASTNASSKPPQVSVLVSDIAHSTDSIPTEMTKPVSTHVPMIPRTIPASHSPCEWKEAVPADTKPPLDVLVVDDDKWVLGKLLPPPFPDTMVWPSADPRLTRTLMAKMIKRLGHRVITAENGEIALDLITAAQKQADGATQVQVVFLDKWVLFPGSHLLISPSCPPIHRFHFYLLQLYVFQTGRFGGHEPVQALEVDVRPHQMWLKAINRTQIGTRLNHSQMPIMTGTETARHTRALGNTVYIAGCTGNALKEDQAQYIAAGADIILTKPIKLAGIEGVIEKARERLKETMGKSGPGIDRVLANKAHVWNLGWGVWGWHRYDPWWVPLVGWTSLDLAPAMRPVSFFFLGLPLLYPILVVTRDFSGFEMKVYCEELDYEVMQCCR